MKGKINQNDEIRCRANRISYATVVTAARQAYRIDKFVDDLNKIVDDLGVLLGESKIPRSLLMATSDVLRISKNMHTKADELFELHCKALESR